MRALLISYFCIMNPHDEVHHRYRYVIHAIGEDCNPFPMDAVPTLEEAYQHAENRPHKNCTNILIIDTIERKVIPYPLES
jgi:hypothetical protein